MINCIKKPRALCFLFALIFTVIVFTASSPAAHAYERKNQFKNDEIYDEQNNTNTVEFNILANCIYWMYSEDRLHDIIDPFYNLDEVVATWRKVSSDPSKYGYAYTWHTKPGYEDRVWYVLVPPEYAKENHNYLPSDFSEEIVGFVDYVGQCSRLVGYDIVKMYPRDIPSPYNTVNRDMTDMLISSPACFAFYRSGYFIEYTYSTEGIGPAPRGDVNGDGKITVVDARLVLRAAIHLERGVLQNCDVDYDGRITVFDARVVLRWAIKSK